MPILSELSTLVKLRRQEMGLSQERLAELSGLSRATINQLENGRLANLSLTNAETLANSLGFGIGVTGARFKSASGAIEAASRTASVSYSDAIPPEVMRSALLSGTVPPKYIAQFRTFLDEAPVGILAAVAAELEKEAGTGAKTTWKRMRTLASALGCGRPIWN